MKHLQMELTNRCNLQCVECPHRFMERKKAYMSEDVLTAIIEKILRPNKLDTIIVHKDGEPLLYPDLPMLLNKLSLYHEGKFDIYTNGLLFTKEFYDFLGKLPNKVCVLFSYHFFNFDGKENNYLPAQVELLRSLETPHPNVEFVFVTHETKFTNPDKLKQWKEFWESIATMSKTISAVHINPHINKWAGRMEEGNTGFSGCPYSDGAHFFVGVTGNVLPCCIDLEEDLILGNILNDSIEYLMGMRKCFYEDLFAKEYRTNLCNRCICE